ncbi:hypothetical protein HK102_002878, partial [Quaeritorhiza haematococci]
MANNNSRATAWNRRTSSFDSPASLGLGPNLGLGSGGGSGLGSSSGGSMGSQSGLRAGDNRAMARTSPSTDHLPLSGSRRPPPIIDNPFEDVLSNEHPWTVRDIGTNAISGILNDPVSQAKKGQQPLKGMDSVPVVPQTVIRKVRSPEFEAYLKSLADVFDRYQYNRAVGLAAATEGTPILGAYNDPNGDSLADLMELASQLGQSGTSPRDTQSKRAGSRLTHSQRTRLLSINAPSLDTVPQIFFDPDFNLTNPRTFQTVCENVDFTSSSSIESTTTNSILQEKLSHYLDIVEVHLIKEISRRSSSFFAALSNLQALNNETLSCVLQIHGLRKKLSNISKMTAEKGLQVVRLKRRRGNLGTLCGAVKLVAEVKQTQPMIQVLLGQGDYVGALDLIEETTMILRGIELNGSGVGDQQTDGSALNLLGGPRGSGAASAAGVKTETLADGVKLIRNTSMIPRGLDLRGVRGLVHLNGQLSEMTRMIGMMMGKEFVNCLVSDISGHRPDIPSLKAVVAASSSPNSNIPNINASAEAAAVVALASNVYVKNVLSGLYNPSHSADEAQMLSEIGIEEEKLQARLMPLVLGLLRMDKLGGAFMAYKESLMKEIKAMMKKHYPPLQLEHHEESSAGTPTSALVNKKRDQQSALAKQLRAMTFDSFFNLLIAVYVTLLYALQRAAKIHQLIVRILNDAQARGVIIGTDTAHLLKLQEPSDQQQQQQQQQQGSTGEKSADEDDDDLGSMDMLNAGAGPQDSGDDGGRFGSDSPSRSFIPSSPPPPSNTGSNTGTTSTYTQMITESSNILFAAADLAHVRCSKLIGVRSEQNAQLNPKDFYRLFGSTWEFVVGGEALCARMCFGLKGTMLSQVGLASLSHMGNGRPKRASFRRTQDSFTDLTLDLSSLYIDCIYSPLLPLYMPQIFLRNPALMFIQAKAFLHHFHEEKSKQIALLIENEQWSQAEVPVDFQHIAEQILLLSSSSAANTASGGGSATSSTSSLASPGGGDGLDEEGATVDKDDSETDLTSLLSSGTPVASSIAEKERRQSQAAALATAAGAGMTPGKGGKAAAKSSKYLMVDGQRFYVVGCVLLFLKMLTEYMQCVENIPVLATDVLNRTLEVLKLFNSRTCQVILGAGAMRSAGLKNITARHIALASQSLGVVIRVIPHLRNTIQRFLPTKQQILLGDFDRLLRDYQEHQSELYSKLVSIMNERLAIHLKNLQSVNWDNPDPKDMSPDAPPASSTFPTSTGSSHNDLLPVTNSMVLLVKETATLHKVLSKYLGQDTLRAIMGNVFRSYTTRIEEDLRGLDLFTSAGKNRLLINVQYFIERLSSLDGIDGPGNHLEVVVNNIKIKDRRTSTAHVMMGPGGVPIIDRSGSSGSDRGGGGPGTGGSFATGSAASLRGAGDVVGGAGGGGVGGPGGA